MKKGVKYAIASSVISVAAYAYRHKREIATMLRNGLNAYLECIPKRKKKSTKKSKKK